MNYFRPDVLTDGQQVALDAVLDLHETGAGGDYLVINGFAGTGKTTVLAIMLEQLEFSKVVTPTGKAALRVREAAGREATTIHRWLYKVKKGAVVTFERRKLEEIAVPPSLMLFIDEASMVGPEIWDDIVTVAKPLGIRIVLIGDEFQLPPVQKGKDQRPFSIFELPSPVDHIRLTEVTRQALESPIIRATMDIRRGSATDALTKHDIAIETSLLDASLKVLEDSGAILCHRNVTRHEINQTVRKHKGYGAGINVGEPLLVLKNNYGAEYMNGEIIQFLGWEREPDHRHDVYDFHTGDVLAMQFGRALACSDYNPDSQKVLLSPQEIHGEADKISHSPMERVAKAVMGDGNHVHCNFGYTLTTHKAQGCEWDSVLVAIENSVKLHSIDGRRWLYTALSRAKENVSVFYM